MRIRRQPKKPLKIKKQYRIQDVTYTSKALYDFHLECQYAKDSGYVTSFEVPSSLSKKSRYVTYKPIIDGIQFDSLMEARYFIKLQKDKKEGVIIDFERQIPFELQPKFKKNGKTYRGIEYVCDFFVNVNGTIKQVIDIKGKETVEFKIKHKLFEYKYPEYNLKLIQFYEPTNEWLELDAIRKLIRQQKKKK